MITTTNYGAPRATKGLTQQQRQAAIAVFARTIDTLEAEVDSLEEQGLIEFIEMMRFGSARWETDGFRPPRSRLFSTFLATRFRLCSTPTRTLATITLVS